MVQNFMNTMQRAKKGYYRALDPICRSRELTHNEMDILLCLYNNPGLDRAADIVTKRGIAKSHVSLSVGSLERRGLLVCREDSRDRRVIHLLLAEEAKQIAAEGRAAQQTFFSRIFDGLTREEAELWQTIVRKVCDNIEKLEE